MARVFISFVHEDRAIAETVKRIIEHDLKLSGNVFMVTDQSQLLAGDDWLKRIKEELTSADVIVLMMSKRAITTPWVNFEAGAAFILNKRIISACFGNQRKGQLPKPYSNWQALELPAEETYLVHSIADHLRIEKPQYKVLDKLLNIIDNKKGDSFEQIALLMTDLSFALKDWKDEA